MVLCNGNVKVNFDDKFGWKADNAKSCMLSSKGGNKDIDIKCILT